MDLSTRRSGVVLHVTSLPGPFGVGDLGADARRFVDWLQSAGQSIWQMLPVHPIGPGHSPYQCPSAFAGSGLMVALEPLVEGGWLDAQALQNPPAFDAQRADFAQATPWRWARLREAAAGFASRANDMQRRDFAVWRKGEASWLADWALFAALKDEHGGQPWWLWSPELARREPAALATARGRLAAGIAMHEFVQWAFDRQFQALKAYAHARGVCLMADLPIFVAHDSADVWARPDLYALDDQHQPSVVAGCPPDGYSPDGQRWGNPLYRWRRMAREGFGWWIARVRRTLAHADMFRVDHFRGFAGYWEVPASCPTARDGRWVRAPGVALFTAIEKALGRLPIVAEDLGTITPDVLALRDHFGFPGMRIVQEAFSGDGTHAFLPHNHVRECLAYSSTHDSDTAVGWWRRAPPAHRAFAKDYLRCGDADDDLRWALIGATSRSVANLALFTMQDVLGLDGGHRMNLPGTAQGNWSWRFGWDMVDDSIAPQLARLATISGRHA